MKYSSTATLSDAFTSYKSEVLNNTEEYHMMKKNYDYYDYFK